MELEAPEGYQFFAKLESILSSHANWITGVAWSPVSWKPQSCPQLLSSSRDKTLIVWAPSRSLFKIDDLGDGDNPDVWLERGRYGNLGGDSLGYRGCAWGNYNNEVYGHGYWVGIEAMSVVLSVFLHAQFILRCYSFGTISSILTTLSPES